MLRIFPLIFYKDMFELPKWVKPEIATPIYYVHVAIIAVVVLFLLPYFLLLLQYFGLAIGTDAGNMLTLQNVLVSIPIITVGDFVAHTVLGLD